GGRGPRASRRVAILRGTLGRRDRRDLRKIRADSEAPLADRSRIPLPGTERAVTGGASWAAVRALFEELVETDTAERARRLAAVTDPELRASVARLLEAEARAGGFLET